MVTKKIDMVPKNTVIPITVIVLLVGWLGGYMLGSIADQSIETPRVMSNESTIVHAHETFELEAASVDLPEVQVLAEQDSKKGWNVSLVTKNFKFTPRAIDEAEVAGEGHAHLWIDGVKVTRLYSNYYYLPELSEGDHEISVTLNTNQHKDFVVEGEIIRAAIVVTEDRFDDRNDSHVDSEPHSHNMTDRDTN